MQNKIKSSTELIDWMPISSFRCYGIPLWIFQYLFNKPVLGGWLGCGLFISIHMSMCLSQEKTQLLLQIFLLAPWGQWIILFLCGLFLFFALSTCSMSLMEIRKLNNCFNFIYMSLYFPDLWKYLLCMLLKITVLVMHCQIIYLPERNHM